MRALLEDLKSGEVFACDVPPPELRARGILVRTHFSAISSGTERVKVETGGKSLLQKALARPDLVRQVLDYARQNGVGLALDKVRSKLDTMTPLGYSCAGVVIEVGEGEHEFRPGDRVACAGGGYAKHAEVNFIPSNLAAKVPDDVPLDAAALTTIGAIAMQGLRQGQVSCGETVAVIGAGLVGLLTIQIARASGCRVIAVDLDPERTKRATSMGAHIGLQATDPNLAARAKQFSRYGADVGIVTAASSSSEPMHLAASLLRDRGRIVVVGDVGMNLSRADLYAKELSVAMSRSYGPGRYDPEYEEKGHDYPVGFVRWTEKRNMEAFLDLLAQGALDLSPLLEKRCPVEEGARAYADILANTAYTVILEYRQAAEKSDDPPSRIDVASSSGGSSTLRLGCIGAGGFARSVIFPNLRAKKYVRLESVATQSGWASESARKSFNFARTERPNDLVRNSDVDAVFVLSRHDSHADYVVSALSEGKSVFVEKPLATTREQLLAVQRAYESRQSQGLFPFLMVGFNRRFSAATDRIRNFFEGRKEPMVLNIRVNAGYLPANHWVHESGGRVIGELCHFVDWARAVVGCRIKSVSARALPDGSVYCRDNVGSTLQFEDGSLATLLYVANGDRALPKERYEVFCERSTACLDDFRTLLLYRHGKAQKVRCRRDKGHGREIEATLDAMVARRNSPIPFEELLEVAEATFAVSDAVRTRPAGASFPPASTAVET